MSPETERPTSPSQTTWKSRGIMMLRRIWNHITRGRTRAALLLAGLAFIGYLIIPILPPDSAAWDEPMQQLMLIIAGVSASAVFLPELSSDLWSLTSEEVRRLVPTERQESLTRALIGARCPSDDWAELVHDRALMPLLKVHETPSSVVWNMHYTMAIHPRGDYTVKRPGGGAAEVRKGAIQLIETSLECQRVLEPSADGYFWIAAARTEEALEREFDKGACLLREHVPVMGMAEEAWWEAITNNCEVTVRLGESAEQPQPDPYSADEPDIVRWKVSASPARPAPERTRIIINFTFPLEPEVRAFPVLFSSYYCAGDTKVSARIYHNGGTARLHETHFFGRAHDATSDAKRKETLAALWHDITFATGPTSLLWPGSGVNFDWSDTGAEDLVDEPA